MNHKPTSFILATFLLVLGLATRAPATAVPLPNDPPLGLTWEFSTLDSTGDVGSFISMAVQPTTGIPHIAYYSAENGLKLAARTGNGNCGPQDQWDCTILVAGAGPWPWVGRYPALAFNTNGEYGVVYQRVLLFNNKYQRYSSYTTASGTTLLTHFYENNHNGTHNALAGVAPGARLWAVRVLDNNGSGTTSSVICGIDWVTANAIVPLNNLCTIRPSRSFETY